MKGTELFPDDDLVLDDDPAGGWACCLPAVCPIHGPGLAVPASCSTTAWHCLLCVLSAAGTEMDAVLSASGCYPFAAPHLLSTSVRPGDPLAIQLSVNGQTSLPPTRSIERGA